MDDVITVEKVCATRTPTAVQEYHKCNGLMLSVYFLRYEDLLIVMTSVADQDPIES
jgi:hypothetical protein